jgi:hypothetical protein
METTTHQGELEQQRYDLAMQQQAAGEAAIYGSAAAEAEQILAENDVVAGAESFLADEAARAEAAQYVTAQPRVTSGTNVGFARVTGRAADGGSLQLTNVDRDAYVAANQAAFAQQQRVRDDHEYHAHADDEK